MEKEIFKNKRADEGLLTGYGFKKAEGAYSLSVPIDSGAMTLMVFADSLAYISLTSARAGDAFKIFGVADFYNGRFSPKIDSMEKLSEDEMQSLLGELVEVAPENADAMRAELFSIIEKIPNPDVRERLPTVNH